MPLDWPDSPIAAGAVHDAIAGFARLLPDGYQDRPIQSAALREMSPHGRPIPARGPRQGPHPARGEADRCRRGTARPRSGGGHDETGWAAAVSHERGHGRGCRRAADVAGGGGEEIAVRDECDQATFDEALFPGACNPRYGGAVTFSESTAELARFGGGCEEQRRRGARRARDLRRRRERDEVADWTSTFTAPGRTANVGHVQKGTHPDECLIHPWMAPTVVAR